MKTRKLFRFSKNLKKQVFASTALMLASGFTLHAQIDMEMKDMFGELNDQVQGSTSVISSVCYAIAGICFLVGGISACTKMLQGREVGKDVGLLFFAMGVFLILGYLCQKFWS